MKNLQEGILTMAKKFNFILSQFIINLRRNCNPCETVLSKLIFFYFIIIFLKNSTFHFPRCPHEALSHCKIKQKFILNPWKLLNVEFFIHIKRLLFPSHFNSLRFSNPVWVSEECKIIKIILILILLFMLTRIRGYRMLYVLYDVIWHAFYEIPFTG